MKDFSKLDLENLLVDTPIGKKKIDLEGSTVSGVRMEVSKAYAGIPVLLQKVIDQNDQNAWQEITNKIDYIYSNLDFSLGNLDITYFVQQH
jgi:short-subunit dehydrogenase involved in D-alanine esterification of teichoic acids